MEDASQNSQQTLQPPVDQSPVMPPKVTPLDSNQTKTIVTILLLVFVYPVGLIVMWVWTKWPKWVKWLISVPFILSIVLAMVFFLKTAFLPAPFQQ